MGRAPDAGINFFDTADAYAGGESERGFALVERMRTMARRAGASVAQGALAWLLSKPAVTSILLGATKLSQMEDNLGALKLGLSGEDLALLDELTNLPPVYPNWFIDQLVDAPLQKALA